jgi:hypothetical protein
MLIFQLPWHISQLLQYIGKLASLSIQVCVFRNNVILPIGDAFSCSKIRKLMAVDDESGEAPLLHQLVFKLVPFLGAHVNSILVCNRGGMNL